MAQAQREREPRAAAGAGLPEEGGLVGIDVGGGGVRVGFFDPPNSLRYLISRPEPTANEGFDPELTWLTVASAIRELTSREVRVRAVGLTAHLATVLVGRDGRPTTEALLWRDNQAWQEAQDIQDALGAELESVTGRRSSAESSAARIRRLAKVSPAALSRTRWLLSLKDYLTLKLTGQVCTDPASASYTQLFDVRRRRWSPEIARKCGVPLHILPAVRPATAVAGRVTSAAAELTGLARHTPVAVGGPDGSAGGLGVGACYAGITIDIAGTTDVLLHVTDAPVDTARQGTVLNAYVLESLWAAGGPTGLTGGGIDWLAATLGYSSTAAAYQDLEPGLAAADPGDLLMRTTLTGRRLPGWNPLLRGRIDGISAVHGPAHLLRAAEDGGVFEVRLGIDALRAIGASITAVITAGGPSGSPRAMQLRADVWGARVGTSADSHASLRGAALAGAVAAGRFADALEAAAAMVPPLKWRLPEPAAARNAEHRYRRWCAIMMSLCTPGRTARPACLALAARSARASGMAI
jgi:xylulokinase